MALTKVEAEQLQAAQTSITSVGTLTSLTVSGALNGTLSTAAQPNITSVGTLTSLSVSGALTSGDITISDATPLLVLSDTGNGGGGGAEAKILFANTDGNAMGIGYTGDTTANSDLIISTNAAGTYGGYLGLAANGIADAQADILLEPILFIQVSIAASRYIILDICSEK